MSMQVPKRDLSAVDPHLHGIHDTLKGFYDIVDKRTKGKKPNKEEIAAAVKEFRDLISTRLAELGKTEPNVLEIRRIARYLQKLEQPEALKFLNDKMKQISQTSTPTQTPSASAPPSGLGLGGQSSTAIVPSSGPGTAAVQTSGPGPGPSRPTSAGKPASASTSASASASASVHQAAAVEAPKKGALTAPINLAFKSTMPQKISGPINDWIKTKLGEKGADLRDSGTNVEMVMYFSFADRVEWSGIWHALKLDQKESNIPTILIVFQPVGDFKDDVKHGKLNEDYAKKFKEKNIFIVPTPFMYTSEHSIESVKWDLYPNNTPLAEIVKKLREDFPPVPSDKGDVKKSS